MLHPNHQKRKLVAKLTIYDDDEDQIPLCFKFNNLKSHAAVLFGGDQGQAHSDTVNTDWPVVKKRRLVKFSEIKKSDSRSGHQAAALKSTKRSHKI